MLKLFLKESNLMAILFNNLKYIDNMFKTIPKEKASIPFISVDPKKLVVGYFPSSYIPILFKFYKANN